MSTPLSPKHTRHSNAVKSILKNSPSLTDLPSLTEGITSPIQQEYLQREMENQLIDSLPSHNFQLKNLLPYISEGAEVVVNDDFSKCFEENFGDCWNWNSYLYPLWIVGVFTRYCILFPIRLLSLIFGWIVFLLLFFLLRLIYRTNAERRHMWERRLMKFIASVFVFSWTGVIKYHGVIPSRQGNQIYVANHSSIIDCIILWQMNAFSVVGQLHGGLLGKIQSDLLGCLQCVWFNRGEVGDRKLTAEKISAHAKDPNTNRLLIFPEGTCVNNEYCVQFKKGVFEMGVTICPIAIKYNKIFVDAYWNSRRQSFWMHLFDLMTSWAVVCDVWYLDPQVQREGESGIEFAARVKQMICEKAGLENVEWDGYMKYYRPSSRFIRKKQKRFAEALKKDMDATRGDADRAEETLRKRK